MAFAAVLSLDGPTDAIISSVLQDLADAEISTSMLSPGYHPHITLGICNRIDDEQLWPALSALAVQTQPLPILLSHIGIFHGPDGVVFFGATVTQPLLDLHKAFHRVFAPFAHEQWQYYLSGQWVPHCTVAFDLTPEGISRAISICLRIRLPLQARLCSLKVAEILPDRAEIIYKHDLLTFAEVQHGNTD